MANYQVILREDIKNLGNTGDLVRVKPGYARNYLIPRGHAALATEGNVRQIEHEKAAAVARAAKLRSSADAIAKVLGAITVEIVKQAGDDGRLYGAVTTLEIAAALKTKGHDIPRKKMHLAAPIKLVGEYTVDVKLAPEVSATVKVVVKGQ